jgi:hypothetical protein
MPVRIPFFDVLSDCLRAYDARRAPEQDGTQSGQPTRIGRKPSFLGGDTKASIAIWIAVMVPGLIMAAALGLEIGAWETAQISTQRSADLAAIAGAANYQTTHNAQTAATFAARMAQLNGGTGTASPTWSGSCTTPCSSACTSTLTDNLVTAKVILCAGSANSSDPMLKVTVNKSVPATLSALFSSASTHTITATGTAEVVSTTTPPSGAAASQPCLVALSSSGTISGSGSTYWTMPNCSVRSNGTVDVHGGGGPLTTTGIFAGGAVNIDSWISTTGGQYPNSGTIPDPYASNTSLQNAFATAAALTGVTDISCGTTGGVVGTPGQYTGNNNCNGTNTLPNGGTCVTSGGVTCTLYPGNYGAFNVPKGGPYTFNFKPGLYLFKGAITLTQNTTSSGSGVTIVTAGAFTGSNTFNFNIVAPTPAQVASTGGIAAIALAGSSATTATISGSAAFNITGAVYFPNAIFDASGSSCSSSSPCFGTMSTACLEIIASSIKTSGYSNFNSNCSLFGAATFTSKTGSTTTVARVVN